MTQPTLFPRTVNWTDTAPSDGIERGALFSPCRTWRYTLWRIWDRDRPLLNVIGLNPSTATETLDDPTIRRCIGYARVWGYGGYVMTNLFAFRATDPKVMKAAPEPVGRDNDRRIVDVAERARMVLAAWGVHGDHQDRAGHVLRLLAFFNVPLYCLGTTQGGHPKHPLYLRRDAKPEPYGG